MPIPTKISRVVHSSVFFLVGNVNRVRLALNIKLEAPKEPRECEVTTHYFSIGYFSVPTLNSELDRCQCHCGCRRKGAEIEGLRGTTFRLALCRECSEKHEPRKLR